MSLRIVLMAAGIVGLLFGGLLLFAPDMAIQSFQLGTSDVPSRQFARVSGSALISVAILNFIASTDEGSPALRGVVILNLLLHLSGIGVDFTETFPKTGGWWVGTIVHVVFIIAFGYYLANWSRAAAKPL